MRPLFSAAALAALCLASTAHAANAKLKPGSDGWFAATLNMCRLNSMQVELGYRTEHEPGTFKRMESMLQQDAKKADKDAPMGWTASEALAAFQLGGTSKTSSDAENKANQYFLECAARHRAEAEGRLEAAGQTKAKGKIDEKDQAGAKENAKGGSETGAKSEAEAKSEAGEKSEAGATSPKPASQAVSHDKPTKPPVANH